MPLPCPPSHPLPARSRRTRLPFLLLTALFALVWCLASPRSWAAPVATGVWTHAVAAFAEPRYPAGFAHFGYVDPDAPKGGLLRLSNPDRRSSFDKYNPYTIKGVAPAAMTIFVFETLATLSMDESMTMYGLLAEAMYIAPDLRSMSFRLHPQARFTDGSPVLAADVVHSFQQMSTAKGVSPQYKIQFEDVAQVVAVDERTVRFDFRSAKVDNLFTAGSLPVFSRRWGGGKPLGDIVTDWPIATGPYALAKAEMPRRLELALRPDYWARGLGVRRGHFNFERIVYQMYKDTEVRREAFKAGEFDLMKEYRASQFARAHQGPKWRDGRIVKKVFEVATGSLPQAFNFNLRRPQFKDLRVRQAIELAWDFDRYNRYGTFRHSDSLFNNTEFAAQGLPTPAELALLEPYRAQLPAAVFGPPYRVPRQDAHPLALRENLRRAAALLAEAGWTVGADGWLRNAEGKTLDIEFLEPNQTGRFPAFERNLKLLGVRYSERLVDFSLYRKRLENFDYDMCVIVQGKFTLPDAGTLQALFGSKNAVEPGGNNFSGVQLPVVDALIERIASATTRDELRTAAHALDRVLMHLHINIPMLFTNTEPTSYWNKFGLPRTTPRYFDIDTLSDMHSQPWPLWTWWDKSLDRRPAAGAATR